MVAGDAYIPAIASPRIAGCRPLFESTHACNNSIGSDQPQYVTHSLAPSIEADGQSKRLRRHWPPLGREKPSQVVRVKSCQALSTRGFIFLTPLPTKTTPRTSTLSQSYRPAAAPSMTKREVLGTRKKVL
jgi:hypothetical protein